MDFVRCLMARFHLASGAWVDAKKVPSIAGVSFRRRQLPARRALELIAVRHKAVTPNAAVFSFGPYLGTKAASDDPFWN